MNYLKYLIFIFASVSFLKSAAQTETYTWHSLKSGRYAELTGLLTNPGEKGLLYARSNKGGAFRRTEQENEWVALLDWVPEIDGGFLDVGSIATDQKEPNRLYLLVGSSSMSNGKTAILRSIDYGNTFETIDVTNLFKEDTQESGSLTGEKLAIDPNQNSIIFCGTSQNGLFKSEDFGVTWNKVNSFPNVSTWYKTGISFVLFDPRSGQANSPSQTIIVGVSDLGSNKFFVSKDGGATFSKITCPTTLLPHRAVVSSEGIVYIAFRRSVGYLSDENGALLGYDLASGLWSDITPPVFGKDFGNISIDPKDPNRIIVTTVDSHTYLSIDKGVSWTFSNSDNAITKMTAAHFDPFDSQSLWASTFNGVVEGKIDQQDIQWSFKANGLDAILSTKQILSVPNSSLMVNTYVFQDVHQTGKPNGLQQMSDIAVSSMNSRLVAANNVEWSDFTLSYSADRGISWVSFPLPNVPNMEFGRIAISSDGKTVLYSPAPYFSGQDPYEYFEYGSFFPRVTHNLGHNWMVADKVSVEVVESYPVADPVNPKKFYIFDYVRGFMNASKDRGQTFEFAGHLDGPGSKIIRAMPDREGDLWVALYEKGLSRSINSGVAFSKIAKVSYCSAVGFGKKAPGSTSHTVYIWGTVDGVTGIFRSIDEGDTWQRINDDQHQFAGTKDFITGDMNVFGRVYMNARSRGIICGQSSLGCEPTSINSFIKIADSPTRNDTYGLFFPGVDVTLSPEPAEGGTWLWTGPGGFESTERVVTFPSMMAEQAGLYRVTYTNDLGCESATQNILLESTIVTAVEAESAEIEVYPNPAPGSAYFRGNSLVKSVLVYDYTGKLVTSEEYNSAEGLLPVEGLPPGLYLLNFRLGNQELARIKFLRD